MNRVTLFLFLYSIFIFFSLNNLLSLPDLLVHIVSNFQLYLEGVVTLWMEFIGFLGRSVSNES